jgi:hypothetical protein
MRRQCEPQRSRPGPAGTLPETQHLSHTFAIILFTPRVESSVVDPHHFGNLDTHPDPIPHPHPDPIPHQIQIRIRICIKVISWIRNRIRIRSINLQMTGQKLWNSEPYFGTFSSV